MKHEDEAYELLEKIAKNTHLWSSPRGPAPTQKRQAVGMYDLDPFNMINAKFDALTNVLAKKMEDLSMLVSSSSSSGSSQQVAYAEGTTSCGVDYREQAAYVGNYGNKQMGNPYSQTYNPTWRNHPNFSWGNQQSQVPNQNFQPQQQQGIPYQQNRQPLPNFQQKNMNPPPKQQEQSSTTEALLQQILANQTKHDEEMREMKARLEQMQTHNRMLENQIAQQASSSGTKSFGNLPSQPENPREQCQAITLRSGKVVNNEKSENSEKRENEKETDESEKQESEKQESAEKCKEKIEEKEENYIPPEPYKPQLPFPQRFQKAKLDRQFGKFLEVLKKLYINVPFIDALSQMPSYAKFLKEILSNKRRLEDHETVALTEECSAILQRKLPPKLKDLGSFSIPCHIGESCSTKALCDLGASVSLMPLSIYEKLNMGDLKPTHISLQLADRSIKYPEGILENIPLKVGKFYIPVDFVILDMEEDSNIPIILGRPFLATAGALIDVKGEKLTLRVGEDHLVFNIGNDKKKQHEDVDSCLRIDIVDELVKEHFRKSYPKASLESCLIHEGSINDKNPKEAAFAQHLSSNPPCPMAPIFQVERVEKSEVKQSSL
ncbi:hypothetical protein P3X46_002263 [Hevea brasiliensis]|uniref:Aspartic peptidase DDI1-type domain-containing protein n=1 Tax=Hevea brasiliensis TaxID=3981 RepID=A0ABQ9N441_HEVBR|nr:hypothetical protein P3X46_002263 [Hevea brasiliensis]